MKFSMAITAGFAATMLAAHAHAKVWTVSATGSASDLQSAVDLAQDGDTILIEGGSYPAGFVIDDKALVVAPKDTTTAVVINGLVTVQNLALGKAVAFVGKTITVAPADARALELRTNQGSVRVQGVTFLGACGLLGADGFEGVLVDHSSDVAFSDAEIDGGVACDWPGNGGVALHADSSSVALYGMTIAGGRGIDDLSTVGANGTNGAAACVASDGFLFGSAAEFDGGNGADGADGFGDCATGGIEPGSGGNGGDGFDLSGATAFAQVFDSTFLAGEGGAVGAGASCGNGPGVGGQSTSVQGGATFFNLPGVPRALHVPAPCHELSGVPLAFEGAPGDRAFIVISTAPRFSYAPQFGGVSLVKSPIVFRYLMGTIGANGTLNAVLPVGDLGQGVQSTTWYAQSLFLDGGGHRIYGGPATLCVLDSAY